jgi:cytochrome c biogenesis protein CcdA/thiol-disulfide isomerase/thioredoxin
MLLLVLVAFVAGLVTAVSPCVLPILPVVLATGADGDRRRPYLVIVGLIASFSFFTLASVQLISALHLPSSALRDVAIAIIAAFGLTLLVPAASRVWERATLRFQALGGGLMGRSNPGPLVIGTPTERKPGSIAGGLLMGLGLGLVWTPCAGPILGAITSLAVTAPGSWSTLILVVAYAIGAGLPLLAIALGGRALIARLRLRSTAGWATRAFGALVIAMAGLMAIGADTAISADLTSALPDWTGTLQTLEHSNPVQDALNSLEGHPQPTDQVAGSTSGSGVASNLPNLGPAPEIQGIDHWLNSGPLTLAALRGKVILVDFWTYSCINCIRTLPYLESWYQKYASEGFVIIGVHSPEFAFEHDTGNVQAAIGRFGITYPVAQDNEFHTWQAYNNEYWPAHYLIDANGNVRSEHFGEGAYSETEAQIRALLAEAGNSALPAATGGGDAQVPITAAQTPETYLGSDRAADYDGSYPGPGSHDLAFPDSLELNHWALNGKWSVSPQFITSGASSGKLELMFQARDVYLVMSSPTPVTAHVTVSGATAASSGTDDVSPSGVLTVSTARLYHLVHLASPGQGTVTISFDSAGAQLYSFTFGS